MLSMYVYKVKTAGIVLNSVLSIHCELYWINSLFVVTASIDTGTKIKFKKIYGTNFNNWLFKLEFSVEEYD